MPHKMSAPHLPPPRPVAIVAAAILLSLTACATQPAPYAPRTPGSATGYTDQKLTSDRYRVTFTGNSATDRQRVEDYLLLRSAQVTIGARYSWFMFDTRDTRAQTTHMSTFTGWRGYGYYWHNWTWGPSYGPPYRRTARAIRRYQAYAEIVLLTDAQARAQPRAIDARQIVRRLAPTVEPESSD